MVYFTVTVHLNALPYRLAVIVTVPFFLAVTFPFLSTAATVVLLDFQVHSDKLFNFKVTVFPFDKVLLDVFKANFLKLILFAFAYF